MVVVITETTEVVLNTFTRRITSYFLDKIRSFHLHWFIIPLTKTFSHQTYLATLVPQSTMTTSLYIGQHGLSVTNSASMPYSSSRSMMNERSAHGSSPIAFMWSLVIVRSAEHEML